MAGKATWLGFLNEADGTLLSNFEFRDDASALLAPLVSYPLITATNLIISMTDNALKLRVCKYQHTPSLTRDWCRVVTGNSGSAEDLFLESTSTYLFASGLVTTTTS